MINLTSYIFILLVYLLELEDALLFLLKDEEVVELIFKVLLIEVIIRLVEEVTNELLLAAVIRVIKAQ